MKQLILFFKDKAPGFIVCTVIAISAQIIASYVQAIGSALFAIGIGILCGNTFLNRQSLDEGTRFSERNLLEYSIVLTGATLFLKDILALGFSGIIFIACQMTLTIITAYILGRRFGFGKKFCLLMGAGNAVCGSSAIATVTPVVKADSKEKGISITIVNVTGTVLMVTLPLLTGLLYAHEKLKTSAMIGGTLQSIGQVIASANLVGPSYVPTTTLFKIIRIVFLVFVSFFYSRLNTSPKERLFSRNSEAATTKTIGIPWFIIGFFILAAINSLGLIPSMLGNAAHTVSQQFEIIALAAIGMRVKFRDLLREGPKALCYGLLIGCFQVLFAFILIGVIFG